VKITRIDDIEHAAEGKFLARPLLEGDQSNVRIIRLANGQALPPHRHGKSDLMLYVVDGEGELDTSNGATPFAAGYIAFCGKDEELRVRNTGPSEMTLLAFLAPKFATG
jgi:quercetin dioxygenase-like cupin family protein